MTTPLTTAEFAAIQSRSDRDCDPTTWPMRTCDYDRRDLLADTRFWRERCETMRVALAHIEKRKVEDGTWDIFWTWASQALATPTREGGTG